jgi:hypothetical protein
MRLLLLFSVSLLWLAGPTARAQSADDFFNTGAHAYISNNIPQALASVETGLKQYPEDVKLKKLYELLKQQSQQQSQNSQSQQNQQPQSQPNQSQQQQSQNHQQNQQPSQQNSQPQNQNQQNPSGQKNGQQQNQPPSPAPGEKQGGKPEDQDGQNQPVAAGQMTPAEAKRLLDAQKGDEQFLQLKPPGKPQNHQPPVRDW